MTLDKKALQRIEKKRAKLANLKITTKNDVINFQLELEALLYEIKLIQVDPIDPNQICKYCGKKLLGHSERSCDRY